MEESFLDKFEGRQNQQQYSGRHHSDVNGKKHQMPPTINLPDLPLVRMQERRGFESSEVTVSAMEKSTFERRRRTHGPTSLSLVNDATDQKIPSIIRPIPDETEEFNLKGSISGDQTDKEDGKRNTTGERVLVQHTGEKTNHRDRVKRSLEASLKPTELELAQRLQHSIRSRQRKSSRMR